VFCYCTVILSHCFNTSLSSHFSIHPCFLLLLDVLRFSPSLSASAFAGRFPPFAITGNLLLSPLQGASAFRGCQAPSVGVFRLRHHQVTPHLPFFAERLPLFAITRRLLLSAFSGRSPPFAITRHFRFPLLSGTLSGRLLPSPSLGDPLPTAFRWAPSAFRHHWAPSAFAITGRLHFSPLSAPSPSTCAITGHFCFSVSLGTFHPHQAPSPSLLALTGRLPLFAITGHFCFSPSLGALCHHFPLLLCASHVSL
jgi:hypothetical protein